MAVHARQGPARPQSSSWHLLLRGGHGCLRAMALCAQLSAARSPSEEVAHVTQAQMQPLQPHTLGAWAAHIRAPRPVIAHKHWEAQALPSPSVQHASGQPPSKLPHSPGCQESALPGSAQCIGPSTPTLGSLHSKGDSLDCPQPPGAEPEGVLLLVAQSPGLSPHQDKKMFCVN